MSESVSEFYQFIWLAENGSYHVLVSSSVVALVLVFLQSFEIHAINDLISLNGPQCQLSRLCCKFG